MKKDHIVLRYLIFIVGLFIASLGVAFSTKAGLGTSPVASVPYSVSLISSAMSFGGWLNLYSVIQIAIQVLLLRSKCNPIEIVIQTILAFAYGYMNNFSAKLISGLTVSGYPMQLAFMLLSCLILGFGIWVQFKGGVAMLPGEAMNRAIATVSGKKYEDIKIVFDVLYIVISAVLGFAFLGGLKGVREGSIIAALLIGNIIKIFGKIFGDKFDRLFNLGNINDAESAEAEAFAE